MTFHIFLGFLLLVGNSLGLILGLAITSLCFQIGNEASSP